MTADEAIRPACRRSVIRAGGASDLYARLILDGLPRLDAATRLTKWWPPIGMADSGKVSAFGAGQSHGLLNHRKERGMGKVRDLMALRKDRTLSPVEIALNPIGGAQNPLVLCSIVDITEQKNADGLFRLVVEACPAAMLMIDLEGPIALANGTWKGMRSLSVRKD